MQIDLFNVDAPCFQITAGIATGATPIQIGGGGDFIRIVNEGPSTAYVSCSRVFAAATLPGATPALATMTSTPVLAGSDVTFALPKSGSLNFAAITASGTAVLDIQVGKGC